ncbi:T9SS type A sorting domain-containing protein [candidate division KSB1 bacterium]|nr:T9SS type A sorting domain-containing protein [candidate division KSB1 bacterium]
MNRKNLIYMYIVLLFTLVWSTTGFSHTIDFQSVSYDNGNTQVTYLVTSGVQPAISHWVFPACEGMEAKDFLSSNDSAGGFTENDPTTGVRGYKFDTGYQDNEQRIVTLTLAGIWPLGQVTVTFKAGQQVTTTTTKGPICETAALEPIIPIFICAMESEDGKIRARFGYYNPNPQSVVIPIGPDNTLVNSGVTDYNGPQPTTFLSSTNNANSNAQAGKDYIREDNTILQLNSIDPANYAGPTFEVVFDNTDEIFWQINADNTTPQQSEKASLQNLICYDVDFNPVRPILECVTDNGDGTYTLSFGYKNDNEQDVVISVGHRNTFNKSQYNSVLPEVFKTGRSDYWPDPAFTVVVDVEDLPLVWTLEGPDGSRRTSTASTSSQQCVYHIFIEKSWNGEGDDQDLSTLRIIAQSDLGSAVCQWDDVKGELSCVYVDNNQKPTNGLLVAPNGDYSVSEENVPAGWKTVSGVGHFNQADGFAESGREDLEKYLTHTVTNSPDQVLEPIEPLLLCVANLGDGTLRAQFGFFNPNSDTVRIPIGQSNLIFPSQYNGSQPTEFPPSNQPATFAQKVIGSGVEQGASIQAAGSDQNSFNAQGNYEGPIYEIIFEENQELYWLIDATGSDPKQTDKASRYSIVCSEGLTCISGMATIDGRPLVGSVVRLEGPGVKTTKMVTDQYGKFSFKNVIPQHDYTLFVQGYSEEAVSVRVDESSSGCNEINLSLGGCPPVLAWYQAWFANADGADSLRFWDENRFGGVIDTSIFDLYDSMDRNIWEYHILLAWAADIDAFVVDWYGKNSYEQSPTQGLLNAAERLYQLYGHLGFDFRIIVSYSESAEGSLDENLSFIADSILTHPAYWGRRENNTRPVYVHAPKRNLLPYLFRNQADLYLPDDAVIFWNWDAQQLDLADHVDGIYPWVQADDIRFQPDGLEWGHDYLQAFYLTGSEFRWTTGASWPGLDDRAWTLGQQDLASRQDTLVYQWSWDLAFENRPSFMMVQSWNDYNRHSQVEPSLFYGYRFVQMTRNNAVIWKGDCARKITNLGLTVPEHVLLARRHPKSDAVIDQALYAFFSRDYQRALALLDLKDSGAELRDNALVLVTGTPTYRKGTDDRGWAKAVDGIDSGWEGTVWARGSQNPGDPAWAIFRFADTGLYRFNYIALTTDNGSDDDASAYPYQTVRFEVHVSTSGTDENDFRSVGTFQVKGNGERTWYRLGSDATARYVKLLLISPDYYPGNWRQVVEFELHTEEKRGAIPAHESASLAAVPEGFALQQNYPNPFNPETTISYTLSEAGRVTLTVFDVMGREIAALVDDYQQAGQYAIKWQAAEVPSGVYLYRLISGQQSSMRRMVLLK